MLGLLLDPEGGSSMYVPPNHGTHSEAYCIMTKKAAVFIFTPMKTSTAMKCFVSELMV
jgi:hypothetical protein